MVWEDRNSKLSGSCSVAAPRKFYDYKTNSDSSNCITKEETSDLIKEYYFSRDLKVTLGNRDEIYDLCIDFGY